MYHIKNVPYKSDLGKIRKGIPDFKSEKQISLIQKVNNFYDSRDF